MIGSDATVVFKAGHLFYADDYNLTAKVPCSGVVGIDKGVCRDTQVGGTDNKELQYTARQDGVTTVAFRRRLHIPGDLGDRDIKEDGETSVIWAVGRLAKNGRNWEPSFHHTYPKKHVTVDFAREGEINNCIPFTKPKVTGAMMMDEGGLHMMDMLTMGRRVRPWRTSRIYDPSKRSFDARVGPSGGRRGYSGMTGMPNSGLAWYIDGILAPEIYLRRGLSYTFSVEGGHDPYNAEHYHPFVISTSQVGGYARLSEDQRRRVKILAGVHFTRRGTPQATAAGRLCLWKHRAGEDRRLDDRFVKFETYRNSLELKCEDEGEAALLEVTPNNSWPDVVYYQSYSTPYMGWRINVVDSFKDLPAAHSPTAAASAGSALSVALLLTSIVANLAG